MKNKSHKKTLIIFPLKKELHLFLENSSLDFQKTNSSGRVYYENDFMILTSAGHGKVNFAIQSLLEMQHWKEHIDALICAGCCGSLIKKIRIGDIIVATSCIEHDYKVKSTPTALPKIPSCSKLLKIFNEGPYASQGGPSTKKEKNLIPSVSFHVYKGPIASGDEDIMDPHQAESIHQRTSAWGVSWEGIGGAKAAKKMNLPFIEIRGVTDLCHKNLNSSKEFEESLNLSIKNLSWFISSSYKKEVHPVFL